MTPQNTAWAEGIKAREEGKSSGANPYCVTCGGEVTELHTTLSSQWAAGFQFADAILSLPGVDHLASFKLAEILSSKGD